MSIVLENLVKRYDGVPIVDRVSLEVAENEMFVLLGASGSGKSTVLRLIAGLVPLEAGRIVLRGRDVTHLPPQQRGCGFVFQNYSLFRRMTVSENIALGMKIRKVPPADRSRKCDELLDVVGLAGLGDRRADRLSGGQQQRVALARALAYEPAVLLLDEPFGALDVQIRVQLRRMLKELRSRLTITTILVTHDQEEAFDLADRVGLMESGGLLDVGTPEEIYSRPRTPFAATFLGAGNVLVGRATGDVVHIGPVAVPLPPALAGEGEKNVQILIRPEHVIASTTGPVPDCHPLGEGTIVERSFAGMSRRLRVRLPRLPLVRQVYPVVPFGDDAMLIDFATGAHETPEGDRAWIGFRQCHVIEEVHPQVLVLDDPDGPLTALHTARELMERVRGRATILAIAPGAGAGEAARAAARGRALAAGFRGIEPRIRFGDAFEQLRIEQAEHVYDFTVLAGSSNESRNSSRLSRRVVEVLDHLRNPLIVVKGAETSVRRILVAALPGEPGRAVVAFAGRLARRLGASVVLLHVTRGHEASAAIRDHLERAERALRALDVAVEPRIREGEAVARAIVEEARSASCDLIALGQHHEPTRWLRRRENVALQVCATSDRSVLVLKDELE
jgi:sulfate transport system ATP-binding protein